MERELRGVRWEEESKSRDLMSIGREVLNVNMCLVAGGREGQDLGLWRKRRKKGTKW